MRSDDYFRAKARWYRDLARREIGADADKLLATARDFDTKAYHRDAHEAATPPRRRRS